MNKALILVLSGAGISAESGLKTFRDQGGLWEGHNVYEVATPEGFKAQPERVHRFYNNQRKQLKTVKPNAAHFDLAKAEASKDYDLKIITQNVDDLHQQAGSRSVWPMHGELKKVQCLSCREVFKWTTDTSTETTCPQCAYHGPLGALRPHIVWFGEMPLYLPEIESAIRHCAVFIVTGTSGNVYPAAGFAEQAKMQGAKLVLANLEPQDNKDLYDKVFLGPCTETIKQSLDYARNYLDNKR